MYLSSPVTTVVNVFLRLIFKWVADPGEPFLWKNNLNPLITPFLKSSGGKCQDAAILVEELAGTIKLAGAREGTAIE